jgi:hypothetical protein
MTDTLDVHLLLRTAHIAGGMAGLLTGAAAMVLRKGSRAHAIAGTAFVVAMLTMSASGATIALFITPVMGNVMGGLLTFYLVLTGWATAWRPPRETGRLEWGAALLGLATAVTGATCGLAAARSPLHRLDGYPPALYFAFGGVALLATLGDGWTIARGGLAGVSRTTRHLWRMCTAMLIATLSFFIGQAKLFPPGVRASGVLRVPVLLVLGALLYWLVRVRIWPRLRRGARPPVATLRRSVP